MFWVIRINREVHRLAVDLARGLIDQYIFHPNPGVIELGLMAGAKQRLAIIVIEKLAHRATQLRQRSILNQNSIGRIEQRLIRPRVREQLLRLRPNQKLAIFGWGLPVGIVDGRLYHLGKDFVVTRATRPCHRAAVQSRKQHDASAQSSTTAARPTSRLSTSR